MTAPTDMRTRGRLGGLTTSSRHDPQVYTANGLRAANGLERFLQDIPTDLPQEERVRRAEAARKLWYVALGQKSAKARRDGRRKK
jgi:hypothetical protein